MHVHTLCSPLPSLVRYRVPSLSMFKEYQSSCWLDFRHVDQQKVDMHTHINTDKQMEYQCIYPDTVTSELERIK